MIIRNEQCHVITSQKAKVVCFESVALILIKESFFFCKVPLLNTSYINGFRFKGNKTFYSKNLECIVVLFWIICETNGSQADRAGCLQPHSFAVQFNPFLNLLEILLPLRNPDIVQIVGWTLNDFWNKDEVIFTAIVHIPEVKGAFMVSFITDWIELFS